MMIGLLVATIGLDPVNGVPRFAFNVHMFEGIPFLPALIGLFAISEVLFMLEDVNEKPVEVKAIKGVGAPVSLFTKMWGNLLRSTFIGYIIGVIPGAGPTVASFVSYNEAKRFSKNKEKFGKGSEEGLAACEAANNSAVAGTCAPLLALGIPASASGAVLIGALTIQGIQPGPLLFTNHPEIPYSIFASLLVSAPIMLVLGLIGLRLWAKVTLIPKGILATLIAAISILSAYSYNNSMYPVWIALLFGIIGYSLRKVDIPTPPIVLALVLGFMMEVNFRRAMTVSGGDPFFIFSQPIALVLIIVSLITFVVPIIRQVKVKKTSSVERVL
jgi:putative tricarboxylic transport membrane protein